MGSIEEKRVYADRGGDRDVFVGCELGVVRVTVSHDRVGEFGVAHRCVARDVTAAGGTVAVATDEDVLRGDAYAATGFGPAVAVGSGAGGRSLLAADGAGRLARRTDGRWADLGDAVGAVAAVDRGLVATADGVFRLVGDDLRPAGLQDVRDVAGAGGPLAATGSGLYALGNGWMDVLEGSFEVVAAHPDGRAHAAGEAGTFARIDGAWVAVDPPLDGRVVDIAHTPEASVLVTDAGTLLLEAGDGWRSQTLGVDGVTAVESVGAGATSDDPSR